MAGLEINSPPVWIVHALQKPKCNMHEAEQRRGARGGAGRGGRIPSLAVIGETTFHLLSLGVKSSVILSKETYTWF